MKSINELIWEPGEELTAIENESISAGNSLTMRCTGASRGAPLTGQCISLTQTPPVLWLNQLR